MIAPPAVFKPTGRAGFTLVEMSIVLVIIGLIIGGVLVGRDLVNAATIRSQISQIEKYNVAVNTFRGKYGYLPGDIPEPYASQQGFAPRGQYPGQGDGDGLMEGWTNANGYSPPSYYTMESSGENFAFWADLTYANGLNINLIQGSFSSVPTIGYTGVTGTGLKTLLPSAKLGGGNFVYVYSFNGFNFFGLSALSNTGSGLPLASPAIAVNTAYAIDQKIDDGLPQSGNINALYVSWDNCCPGWAGNMTGYHPPYTTATAGSSTTCFDNSASASGTPGVNGTAQHYSTEVNNGNGLNCALSFKFQ